MRIVIASDHGGYEYKQKFIAHLTDKYEIRDLGPHDDASVDYPDYAHKLCTYIPNDADMGILLCGTGIGMSIVANRYNNIRAALCKDEESACLARQHNDANVLALGERVVGSIQAIDCVQAFLDTPFAGGRHQKRIDKLSNPKLES